MAAAAHQVIAFLMQAVPTTTAIPQKVIAKFQ
jgi:hypothetical protein